MAVQDSKAGDRTRSLVLEPVKEDLMFEGFLRKRKDTMKFTWAKYWFKLQNTTLYFYIKRPSVSSGNSPGSKASKEMTLRGQYYMYSVQSVRSVSSSDTDFTFEIVMKNGKRKLLSAETEALRDVWIKLLWKSMQLPGPGRHSSSCTWYDIPDLVQRGHSTSVDSDQDTISPDSTLQDNVFEQSPTGDHIEVNYSGEYNIPNSLPLLVKQVAAGQESGSSPCSELYDVLKPQRAAPAPPCVEGKVTSHVKNGSSCNTSDLFCAPRPQEDISDISASQCDPVLDQQCLSMNQMSIYDSPTLKINSDPVPVPEQECSAMDPLDIYDTPPKRISENVGLLVADDTTTDGLYSNFPLPDIHPTSGSANMSSSSLQDRLPDDVTEK